MKKVLLAAALMFCCCQFVCASTLFYNGDVDTVGLGALNNTVTAGGGGQMVFDDFVVPEGGWDISAVFSNNQVPDIPLPYTATGGTWEIWSDLDGAGQTLVASGSTTTDFSWTPHWKVRLLPGVYSADLWSQRRSGPGHLLARRFAVHFRFGLCRNQQHGGSERYRNAARQQRYGLRWHTSRDGSCP